MRLVAGERHRCGRAGRCRGRRSSRWPILAANVCVLTHGGPDAAFGHHQTSTSNFMRKAPAGPIEGAAIADTPPPPPPPLLKLGRSLMVFEVDMVAGPEGLTRRPCDGDLFDPPEAEVTVTPVRRGRWRQAGIRPISWQPDRATYTT